MIITVQNNEQSDGAGSLELVDGWHVAIFYKVVCEDISGKVVF